MFEKFNLPDDEERKEAVSVLSRCKEEILEEILERKPLRIKVGPLEIMNDDMSEVDVVYARVEAIDGSDKLQQMCDKIHARFAASGLLCQERWSRVKLHATLLNTLFRSRIENSARNTLDARKLMEDFGHATFGEITINEVHLSQRTSGVKRENGGYYRASAIVKFNA